MPVGTTSGAPQVLLAHHLKQLKLPTVLREYDKVARECARAVVCIRLPAGAIGEFLPVVGVGYKRTQMSDDAFRDFAFTAAGLLGLGAGRACKPGGTNANRAAAGGGALPAEPQRIGLEVMMLIYWTFALSLAGECTSKK
jgi:hypothetical protein